MPQIGYKYRRGSRVGVHYFQRGRARAETRVTPAPDRASRALSSTHITLLTPDTPTLCRNEHHNLKIYVCARSSNNQISA